jgi:hypothetical protein
LAEVEPTSAAVAGVVDLSKLLATTLAPGITGSSLAGKPATRAPTVADVPGEALGLAVAVADAVAVAGLVAAAAGEVDAVAAGVAEPGACAVHADAATITAAPAASSPRRAGMSVPMTFTGGVLLGVDAGCSLQFSQVEGIGLQL